MMHRFLGWLCVVAALLVGLSDGATAETYPAYTNIYVNDFADLLPAGQEADLSAKLAAFTQQTDIEFTVVTIFSLAEYDHSGSIESYATGLFNTWGVGDAQRNDGVMMLISQADRKMRIEVGSGYGSRLNRPMKAVIDDVIIPHFRDGDFPGGIQAGVDAVIAKLGPTTQSTQPQGLMSQTTDLYEQAQDRFGGWLYAIFAPIAAGFVWIYRRWRRMRPRYCKADGQRMRLLDEDADDAHLKHGNLQEERLNSVDHDVWCCPTCNSVTIESYRNWFSRYGACTSCNYRTVYGNSTVLQQPTTSSTGVKKIDYHCENCKAHYSKTVIMSKLSNSSSSSSSFGGGRSSGGGASGSW